MHGSRFDLTTGVPTGPPANQPIPVYPVRITDTGIDVVLPADPPEARHMAVAAGRLTRADLPALARS